MSALDRLNIHVAKFPEESRLWWEEQFNNDGRRIGELYKRGQQNPVRPLVDGMPQVAALIPIPIYLKHKTQHCPDLFANQRLYAGTVTNIIYEEIPFPNNSEARLELLELLTQESVGWPHSSGQHYDTGRSTEYSLFS